MTKTPETERRRPLRRRRAAPSAARRAGAVAAALVVCAAIEVSAQPTGGPASTDLGEIYESEAAPATNDAFADLELEPDHNLLPSLLDAAQRGEGDPHLPFVIHRLEQAMNAQNLIGFLDLVEPMHFADRFDALRSPERSPGRALNEFSCTFFSLCDVSKAYAFTDVVSARAIAMAQEGRFIRVRMEMRMWDGIFLTADIFYDPETARLLSEAG